MNKIVGTSWTLAAEQHTKYFKRMKKHSKYPYISNSIFTMMGAPEKEVILRCFFQNEVNCLCAKFEVPPIPPTGFLPIKATSFTNIRWAYFSLNICTVVHQSELEWSDLDQNWAKTRPLLSRPLNIQRPPPLNRQGLLKGPFFANLPQQFTKQWGELAGSHVALLRH